MAIHTQPLTPMPSPLINIHTDGGARGNPGPAAIGIVMESALWPEKKCYGEYIGETTNNIAEYQAVIFALKKIFGLLGKEESHEAHIVVNTDSELIARQIMGKYKVKMPHLKPLHAEAVLLQKNFASVAFTIIPREKNKEADALVNDTLDSL